MTVPSIIAIISGSEPLSIIEDIMADEQVADTIIDADDAIDYVFFSGRRRLIVERKEVGDMCHSFLTANEASGEPRLVAQMRQLAAEQDEDTRLVLLREGHMGNHRGFVKVGNIVTGVRYNALDNFLVSLQGWGIRVAHSPSQGMTSHRLLSLAEAWLSDEVKSPLIMLPRAPRPQLRTLMTFPGVGIKRAKALLSGRTLYDVLFDLLSDNVGLDKGTSTKVEAYLLASTPDIK